MAYQDWELYVGDGTSGLRATDLSRASQRSFTWYRTQPCTAAFHLDGRDTQAAAITETESDLWVARKGDVLLRGRLGSSTDSFGGSNNPLHDASFSAVDYRGFLQRRIVWPWWTASFNDTAQEDIAWSLVSQSQAEVAGDLGIQKGIWPTSSTYLRTLAFNVGDVVENDITTMAGYANGFDWEIDANLRMNLWYPNRGRELDGLVLMYGDNVLSGQRTKDTTKFATAALQNGGTQSRWDWCFSTSGSVSVTDTNIGSADTFTQVSGGINSSWNNSIASLQPGVGFTLSSPAGNTGWFFCLLTGTQLSPATVHVPNSDLGPPPGKWEASFSDSSINNAAALQDAATASIESSGALVPSYALNLKPGWWDPSLLWLGDTVRTVVHSGRIQEDSYLGVTQITVTLDDAASQETVTVTVGPIIQNLALRLRDYDKRFQFLSNH